MTYLYETKPPLDGVRSIAVSRDIPTDILRELLCALTEAALQTIAEDSGLKLITAIATLAKTLRETEQFNASLYEASKDSTRDYSGDDLQTRLKDFQPTTAEEREIFARVKTYLHRIALTDDQDAA